ncbi:hypothetical protein [Marinospirillum sp.]|uniref:hypothetical protein n=1 Tax=Marinospirillum sp. TaxID=2183934 RepID=UPI00384D8C84
MLSLEKKLVQQREILMARGPDIRLHARRIHTRLGHPVVLIPAFLAGMLFAQGAPLLLKTLPPLTTRLVHLTAQLRKLNAFFRNPEPPAIQ